MLKQSVGVVFFFVFLNLKEIDLEILRRKKLNGGNFKSFHLSPAENSTEFNSVQQRDQETIKLS